MPDPAAKIAARRRLLAGVGSALVLLGAFWLVAVSCGTPERGSRLFDQGRVEEARPLLAAAAARDSVPSSYRLGLVLESGGDGPPDLRRALALFRHAAGKRDVPAMTRAGDLERRLGDPAQAARFYRQAADRGDVPAMARLGAMLFAGAGIAPDAAHCNA